MSPQLCKRIVCFRDGDRARRQISRRGEDPGRNRVRSNLSRFTIAFSFALAAGVGPLALPTSQGRDVVSSNVKK
eukprot:175547-Prymnesium_polylepis.1